MCPLNWFLTRFALSMFVVSFQSMFVRYVLNIFERQCDQPFICLYVSNASLWTSYQDCRIYLTIKTLLSHSLLKPPVVKLSVHLLWPMVFINWVVIFVNSFVRYLSIWRYFSVKPSATCSPPQEFFEHWTHFSSDFLLFWRKEQQVIAKDIYEETKRKVYKEKVEGLAVKPATSTGLKLKLASSKKSNANWSIRLKWGLIRL